MLEFTGTRCIYRPHLQSKYSEFIMQFGASLKVKVFRHVSYVCTKGVKLNRSEFNFR